MAPRQLAREDLGITDNAIALPRCHFDVVVVGLGPVGATLALLLGKRGVSVLAIDEREHIFPLPRAAHFDHEVMRIFQSVGLAQRIQPHLREAPDYEFRNAKGEALLRFNRAGIRGGSGWATGYNIYQPGIEAELRRALVATPGVTLDYGTRFEGVVSNSDAGVVARISGGLVDARFLVGCDGASSPVRESLGVRLDDYGFDEPWLVLDARTPDESGFPMSNLQLCDPARPTTFIHMGPGRLRWEFMLKPHEDPRQMLQAASLQALLEPWRAMGAIEVERSAIYRFHGLVAKQWRDRRVFLAGDAAHQMPPFMGQGMCAGLRDAANLAWKLERVLRSGWHQALLDSYQSERDPHVRFVIQRAIEMGRVVCTLDPEAAARRDAEMLAAPRIGAPAPLPGLHKGWLFAGTPSAGEMFPQPFDPEGGSRLDDRLGPGTWLLRRGGSALDSGEQLVDVNLESDLPEPLAAPLRAWLDKAGQSAVLVRPDRYVFGTGEPAELLQAYLGQGAAMPAPATCARTTMAD